MRLLVQEVFPPDQSEDVPLDTVLTMVFNREIRPGSNAVRLSTPGDTREFSPIGSQVTIENSTVTIVIKSNLLYSEEYAVTIPKGAFNYLHNKADNEARTYTFTTRLRPPANVLLSSPFLPGVQRTGIAIDSNIGFDFDKDVFVGSNVIVTLENLEDAGDRLTIPLNGERGDAVQLVFNGVSLNLMNSRQVIIDPTSDLQEGMLYRLTMPNGAILNDDAIPTGSFSTTFRTAYPLPILSSKEPLGTSTPVSTNVILTFNTLVVLNGNGAVVDIRFEDASARAVEFEMTMTDLFQVILEPVGSLRPSTTYQVYVPSDTFLNADGVPYSNAIDMTFTTRQMVTPVSLSLSNTERMVRADSEIIIVFNSDLQLRPDRDLQSDITLQALGGDEVDFTVGFESNTTLTVTPLSNLKQGVSFEFALEEGLLETIGDTLVNDALSLSFTTEYPLLSLQRTSPTGAGIERNPLIELRFDRGAGLSQVNTNLLTLQGGGLTVDYSFYIDNDERLVITPLSHLDYGELYTLNATANAFVNGDGIFHGQNVSFDFRVKYAEVSLQSMSPSGDGVQTDTSIELVFNGNARLVIDDVNLLSLNAQGQDVPITASLSNGDTVLVIPNSPLTPGTTHRFEARSHAFKNSDDVFYESSLLLDFRTGYNLLGAPTNSPLGTQVDPTTNILITFNTNTGLNVIDASKISLRSNGSVEMFTHSVISDHVLLITPGNGLKRGTTYMVEVLPDALANGDGMTYNAFIDYMFTTMYEPLQHLSSSPTGDRNPPNVNIFLIFNTDTGLTIDSLLGITLQDSMNNVITTAVSLSNGNQLILAPSVSLRMGERYTVTVPSNAIKNGDDLFYDRDIIYDFGVNYLTLTAPSIAPLGDEVAVDTDVVITFNQGTGLTIDNPNLVRLQDGSQDVPIRVLVQNEREIVIDPISDLEPGVDYILEIPAGNLMNGNGVQYQQVIQSTFRTAYTVLNVPTTSPTGQQVPTNSNILITFDARTGLSLVDESLISVRSNGVVLSINVRLQNDDSLLIRVSGGLKTGTSYDVEVDPNALMNGDGYFYNQYITYSFRTVYPLLSLAGTQPTGSRNPTNAAIIITFNEGAGLAMNNPSGITVMDASNNFVSTAWSISNGHQLVISPSIPFVLGETYTVNLDSNTVQNGDDVGHAQEINYSFGVYYPELTNTALLPVSGATGVSVAGNVVITFNQGTGLVITNTNHVYLRDGAQDVPISLVVSNDTEIVLDPVTDLEPGKTYTVYVPSNTLRNGDYIFYTSNINYSFQTAYTLLTSPTWEPTAATGVAITNEVKLVFASNTGLRLLGATMITVNTNGTLVNHTASVQGGHALMIVVDGGLQLGTSYDVNVLSGALANGDNQIYSSDETHTFRTVYEVLSLSATYPSGMMNASNVVASLTFNEGAGLAIADPTGITIRG